MSAGWRTRAYHLPTHWAPLPIHARLRHSQTAGGQRALKVLLLKLEAAVGCS